MSGNERKVLWAVVRDTPAPCPCGDPACKSSPDNIRSIHADHGEALKALEPGTHLDRWASTVTTVRSSFQPRRRKR